jgi:hypothetical protein
MLVTFFNSVLRALQKKKAKLKFCLDLMHTCKEYKFIINLVWTEYAVGFSLS